MSRFREPVNGFTHLAGAVLAAAGLVWLLVLNQNEPARMVAVAVYGVSMIALYTASATLHLTRGTQRVMFWLRRLDHAAIYLLIAGTYTPIVYMVLTGQWRWGTLVLMWGAAVAGVVYKLLFLKKDGWLSLLFYIGMGCLGLVSLPQAVGVMPGDAAVLIALGGAVYIAGALIFGFKRPNPHPLFGHHEIWHLFVLGGSAFHYAAIVVLSVRLG
ncbi:MAG: hemolysin III family protein [Anaerolineaceae bacterium]|nr:hemolysin III family protein [Anaerolineaceae bacterium]